MVEHVKPKHTSSEDTAHASDAAIDKSIAKDIWTEAAKAEIQLQLLQKLRKANTGLNDVEKFVEKIEEAKKFKNKKNQKKDIDLVNSMMDRKIWDAEKVLRQAETRKTRMRRRIENTMGKNTRQTRTLLKYLRKEATSFKTEIHEEKEKKEEHLKKKHNEKENEVPEILHRYRNLKVFSGEENEENEKEKIEVPVIDTEADLDELSFLELPPKFSILTNLDREMFETQL